MHSWIFRHRQRLSAVFGMVTGESVDAVETPEECNEGDAEQAATDGGELSPAPRSNRLGIPPGGMARREHYVVLAPMARRSL